MAVTIVPTDYLPSWSEDATNITVPIASITGLTADEADGTTGDIREILRTILDTIYAVYAAQASADRWTKCAMTKSASVNTTTNVITNQFVVTFSTSLVTENMVAEA